MSEPFIVHCHIPGTDGSVLNHRLLFPMYGENCVFRMYERAFEATSRLPRKNIARAMRSFVAVGHVPFGYFDDVYPDATYISAFHEPTARFLAELNHALTDPHHSLRDHFQNAPNEKFDDPDRTVGTVLDQPKALALFANAQIRLASGAPRLEPVMATADHLDAALRNMAQERYLTGTNDNLPALFNDFLETFPNARVKTATPDAHNNECTPLKVEHLGARTLDRIRSANDLDLRLYATLHEARAQEVAHAA